MFKMGKIEVYVCEPGNRQYYKEIDNTIEAMQELIGGYVEQISIPFLEKQNIYLMADEEGKMKGKDRSVWIDLDWVVGTCFFVKQKGGSFTTLSEKDKKAIEQYMSGEATTSVFHAMEQYIKENKRYKI